MRLLVVLAVCAGCSRLETDPDRVTFGGRTYHVEHAGAVSIGGRALGAGTLIVHDFDGDARDDLALYTDTRDGFRDTFAYLDLYIDDGAPLDAAEPIRAKWKEGRWVWIDATHYPGLGDGSVRAFMRARDADH